ncbi:MAG: hypothetical protein DBX47_01970 [Clostridiales bacterium]|nr:MAG: hypothetical protein DBX47_01970 [Clostridiales bacterium]
MRNSVKRVNKFTIRKIVFNICMPIILACISFVVLFTVIYSQIGNPGRYIEILSLTTKSSEQLDLLTLKDIYEGDKEPETEVPIVIPGGPGSTDVNTPGGNGDTGGNSGTGNNIGNSGDNSSDDNDPTPPPSSDIVFPTYNTRYGVFEVPKYNMKQDLYFGASYAAIEKGVGQAMGSYLPGFGGTTIVCTHNSRVRQFESSKPLTPGDEIIIRTNYGVYKYLVENISVVSASNLIVYTPVSKNNNDLIFYTCYPLHTPSGATQRMVITAKLVSGNMLDV